MAAVSIPPPSTRHISDATLEAAIERGMKKDRIPDQDLRNLDQRIYDLARGVLAQVESETGVKPFQLFDSSKLDHFFTRLAKVLKIIKKIPKTEHELLNSFRFCKFWGQSLPIFQRLDSVPEIPDEKKPANTRFLTGEIMHGNVRYMKKSSSPFFPSTSMLVPIEALKWYINQRDLPIVVTGHPYQAKYIIKKAIEGKLPVPMGIVTLGEDSGHVTPIVVHKAGDEVQILISDSVGWDTLTHDISKIQEHYPNVKFFRSITKRQADEFSCRIDALHFIMNALDEIKKTDDFSFAEHTTRFGAFKVPFCWAPCMQVTKSQEDIDKYQDMRKRVFDDATFTTEIVHKREEFERFSFIRDKKISYGYLTLSYVLVMNFILSHIDPDDTSPSRLEPTLFGSSRSEPAVKASRLETIDRSPLDIAGRITLAVFLILFTLGLIFIAYDFTVDLFSSTEERICNASKEDSAALSDVSASKA